MAVEGRRHLQAGGDGDGQPAHQVGRNPGAFVARQHIHDQLVILRREQADGGEAVELRTCSSRRRRVREAQRLQAGCDGAFDHEGARGEVAQAPRLAVAEHGDQADRIGERQEIDDTHQVADGDRRKAGRRTVVPHHLDAGDPLARGLAVPQPLEEDVVAPNDGEIEEPIDPDDRPGQPLGLGLDVDRRAVAFERREDGNDHDVQGQHAWPAPGRCQSARR